MAFLSTCDVTLLMTLEYKKRNITVTGKKCHRTKVYFCGIPEADSVKLIFDYSSEPSIPEKDWCPTLLNYLTKGISKAPN